MQVELTAQHRKAYYKRALREFESHRVGPFLCNVLQYLLIEDYPDLDHSFRSDKFAERYFPEFWAAYTSHTTFEYHGKVKIYDPFDHNESGNLKRRQVLTEAMEILTHKKVFI